eukprot:gene16999-8501_t
MAGAGLIQPVPPFDAVSDPANACNAWKRWVSRFEQYLVAADIKDDKRKRALLIYLAGEPVADILNTIPDNGDDYKTALEKLTGHFEPQKNLLHETYLFRQARQEPNETLGQFHVRLQNLASRCDFGDRKEFEILLQIVTNGSSSRLRKKALRDPKYTLKEMLLDGQRDETSTQQASSIEGNTEIKQEVHRVIQSQHKKGHVQTKKCHQCGGSYPHKNQTCPAAGKICHKCGKKNHFAKYCMSKTQQVPRKTQPFKRHVRPITTKSVNKAQSDSDSDFDYLYAVKQKKKPGNAVTAKISDYKCDLLVDTGASVNILDEETFSQIPSDPKLEKTTVKVYPYNSNSPVKLLGKFQATVETKKRITVATFYVTEGNSGSLLGSETSQELGLVTFHINPMVSKKDDDDDDLSDDDNHKRTETVEENNRENRYPLRQRRMPERYGTVVATD